MAIMSEDEALEFVRSHGIVLVSAKGPAPRLTEAIAGESISGSWWSHPQSRRIFRVLQAVTDSDEVLVCRLLDGKVTLVHSRLLPALVRLADRLPPERIARVCDVHTPTGKHVTEETPYPQWVTPAVRAASEGLTERAALDLSSVLAACVERAR